ncbi:MAG: peptide deformylase [Spirochaetaceae bacterium]|nr:peptide deformylase [Spirochaetaceae bacterium]
MELYTLNEEEQIKVLRSLSEPVENIDDQLVDYVKSMIDFMEDNNGIGLAAPQVGRNQRFFVIRMSSDQDPLYFINPEIIGTSTELSNLEEGCLSIPEMYGKVERPAVVQVQAYNLRGRPFKIEADGLLSHVIQHEYDHLQGKLFIDYLSERKQKKIFKNFKVE